MEKGQILAERDISDFCFEHIELEVFARPWLKCPAGNCSSGPGLCSQG